MRIGHGYDSHRFAEGRPLILGGVRIPSERGLSGHSDADAVAHAITDALLGAAGLGADVQDSRRGTRGADRSSHLGLRGFQENIAAARYGVRISRGGVDV